MKVPVKFKRLTETATIPTRGSMYAAGYDLYADCQNEINITPHTTELIGTGLILEIPEGYFGGIYARSGLATKRGLNMATGTSILDADYRGEVFVPVHNMSDKIQTIFPGDRIAQLVIQPFIIGDFQEVEHVTETERGEGGFGSTGTN